MSPGSNIFAWFYMVVHLFVPFFHLRPGMKLKHSDVRLWQGSIWCLRRGRRFELCWFDKKANSMAVSKRCLLLLVHFFFKINVCLKLAKWYVGLRAVICAFSTLKLRYLATHPKDSKPLKSCCSIVLPTKKGGNLAMEGCGVVELLPFRIHLLRI